jgi:acetoacetate decarboxylase
MHSSYPPAPWQLYGNALATLQLVDVERSREFIPAEFQIIPVLPGKTVGGLYFALYEGNSTLTYSELIVMAGLVRYRNQWGAWISHIYVDNPASVAGGRNIWGLPKELAEFEWQDKSVTVRQEDAVLCQFRYQPGLPFAIGMPKIRGNILSVLDNNILRFQGDFAESLNWIQGTVTISATSPFSGLNLVHPWVILQLNHLYLNANAPGIVGQLQPENKKAPPQESFS